jgi:hypothetical protein
VSGVRCQMSEDRCQTSEDREQRTENRRQKTDIPASNRLLQAPCPMRSLRGVGPMGRRLPYAVSSAFRIPTSEFLAPSHLPNFCPSRHALCALPYAPFALCALPYAPCPMRPCPMHPLPYAPCPMRPALCTLALCTLCPMRPALCALPYAPCPLHPALCALPYAPCPMPVVSSLTLPSYS